MVEFNQILKSFLTISKVSSKMKFFDLFQSLWNFFIESGANLIDFIATIKLDSKNLDRKLDKNLISIQLS